MKTTARALLLIAMAVLFCSCVTNRLSQDVEVSLANMQFGEVTPLETTANFVIRIQNQMPQPLGIEGSVHKIYLNGVYIGSGVSDEVTQIPRLAEGQQNVRVHLRNLSMARLIRDIVESRRVDYRLESQIFAQIEGRSTRLRVSKIGNLDLKDFQPTRPATP
jgi:LEA14-like dessication related protein